MLRRGLLIALAAGLAAVRVHAVLHAWHGSAVSGDIDRYLAIASAPGAPYADSPVEYPPLTLGEIHLLHLVAPSRVAMGQLLVAVTLVMELMIAAVLARGWGWPAATAFLIADSLLIDALLTRIDMLSTLLAVVAVWSWRRNRQGVAGLTLALGAAAKVWPVVLLPALVLRVRGRDRRRLLVASAAGAGVVLVIWAILGRGLSGVGQVLTFRGAQGWQIESVVGSAIRLLTAPAVHAESGAYRFGTVPAGVAPLLLLAALAITLFTAKRARRLSVAWIAAVGAFLCASTLFSPQYVLWLLPAVGIAWAEGERRLSVLVALVTVPTWTVTFAYGALLGGDPLLQWDIVVRNALVLAAVVVAVVIALRGNRAEPGLD